MSHFYDRLNVRSVSAEEDKVTEFWKSSKIFEKSINQRDDDNHYSFLDGPPFVTGYPHYGHLLGRIAKDVIPRYWTMKDKKVRRVWGWDCHGIPIEEKTEEKLNLKNKPEVKKYGVYKFLDECKNYVNEISNEWEWYIDKIGEWIDFKNAYRTMDEPYMESVIWVFKQLYNKGLIYEGVKTMLYCTRCGTPISKFEIAMDDSYEDMEDPAVTVEFPVKDNGKFKGASLLAWTTTPWTLPSNRALVVAPKATYVLVKVKDKLLVLAKDRIEDVLKDMKYSVIEEFKGKELCGLLYTAPYDFFEKGKNDFKVYEYEGMATTDEGTGIVHSAPGFGEIDTEMGKACGLTMMFTVDDEGKFVETAGKFKGLYVKKANNAVIEDLSERDLLFKNEKIVHRYPYCYRCKTPLIYRSVKSWFLDVQSLKPKLLENAKNINWVPSKFNTAFVNNIKEAPDWCISRTRYWATIMPVWRCEKCGEIEVFGSKAEIEKRANSSVKSLHMNGVDHIKYPCAKCDGKMSRVPEVLDCWFESGSMPYGQLHYPFENEELFKKTFPGDYIIEYVAQIRAWFFCMHVLSTALMDSYSFKNVIVTGVMAGNDGRKMSKSLKNYKDPKDAMKQYGGDALRLYFMGNPVMLGENPSFDEEEIKNQLKNIILPYINSVVYLQTYAKLFNWNPSSISDCPQSKNVLDKWVVARLKQFHTTFEKGISSYRLPDAVREIDPFVSDLSTWYIRRSRDRFAAGDVQAMGTLYYVLTMFTKTVAPIMAFASEYVYRAIVLTVFPKELESVHLCEYPVLPKLTTEEDKLTNEMKLVRDIASAGQAIRVTSHLKLKQPLSGFYYDGKLSSWQEALLLDELNVKSRLSTVAKDLTYADVQGTKFGLNTTLSDRLVEEGMVNEVIRAIQATRKASGCEQSDEVALTLFSSDHKLIEIIKSNEKRIMPKVKVKAIEYNTTDTAGEGVEHQVGSSKIKVSIKSHEMGDLVSTD